LGGFDGAFGFVHHLLGRAPRAGVFADGLLGEDGSKVEGQRSKVGNGTQGGDVTWGG